MEMVGSYDGNITALLSRTSRSACRSRSSSSARRAEEEVPAALRGGRDLGVRAHRAARRLRPGEPVDDRERQGDSSSLNGEKLWCTNGTLAELLVVMARDPQTKKISAFVVETDWPGVKVEYRCHFMGLKGTGQRRDQLQGRTRPARDLIGEEGKGLKIALITLNTGA
jgi:alkylation response protein AidB-like acyl-CoA dehydrogenase